VHNLRPRQLSTHQTNRAALATPAKSSKNDPTGRYGLQDDGSIAIPHFESYDKGKSASIDLANLHPAHRQHKESRNG
jgi:hypothetical protein